MVQMHAESSSMLADPNVPSSLLDGVALARLYGEPLFHMPDGLYIPPDALEVFLESFEGPLDLLLYLIRKQKFDILDIPMAVLTEQYMQYVELIRKRNLELAADYLVMAANLMQIKSQLLLPVKHTDTDEEVQDPQAELARRLLEYERIKLAAQHLDEVPREGREFVKAYVTIEQTHASMWPDVDEEALIAAWQSLLNQAKLKVNHRVARQELSVREYMTSVLRKVSESGFVEFQDLFDPAEGPSVAIVNYLAILELAKEGLIKITQAAPFAPLYVSVVLWKEDENVL